MIGSFKCDMPNCSNIVSNDDDYCLGCRELKQENWNTPEGIVKG